MEVIPWIKGNLYFQNNDAKNISLGAYFISNSELFRRWRLSTKVI